MRVMMKKNKIISADQKLKIQSKFMRTNQLFSRFADELEDQKMDDLSDGLLMNLSLSAKKTAVKVERKKEMRDKVERKKEMRDKVERKKEMRDKVERKKEMRDKVLAIKNWSRSAKDLFGVKDSSRFELSDVSERKKTHRSKRDFYVKTICKQLRTNQVQLISKLVQTITPANALKISNQVFKEEVIERCADENENEYRENELVDKFLQLIQKDKSIPDRKKLWALESMDHLNLPLRNRRLRVRRKEATLRKAEDLDQLKVVLDKFTFGDGNGSSDVADQKKNFDFK